MKTRIQDLIPQTEVIPVKKENRIKLVTRLEDGSLNIEQQNGSTFTISKNDPEFQQFAIWMILSGG